MIVRPAHALTNRMTLTQKSTRAMRPRETILRLPPLHRRATGLPK